MPGSCSSRIAGSSTARRATTTSRSCAPSPKVRLRRVRGDAAPQHRVRGTVRGGAAVRRRADPGGARVTTGGGAAISTVRLVEQPCLRDAVERRGDGRGNGGSEREEEKGAP